jgi:hypothetical protein
MLQMLHNQRLIKHMGLFEHILYSAPVGDDVHVHVYLKYNYYDEHKKETKAPLYPRRLYLPGNIKKDLEDVIDGVMRFSPLYFKNKPYDFLNLSCNIATNGGARIKVHVKYNTRSYLLQSDKAKKKYIVVNKKRVYLSDIKGKYRYIS